MRTRELMPGAVRGGGDDDPARAGPIAQEAELTALRARLREVEAALGLPAREGQPAPPPLPALLRRVAALERRAGIVPGLVPLPGCGTATTTGAADRATVPPRARRQAWRD